MKGNRCSICGHTNQVHYHSKVQWEQVTDEQVPVDQDMKKRWEDAKDGEEKTAALIEAGRKMLNVLNQVIDEAMNELVRLVDEYACLSLSGSFAAQMEKAVGLLEQRYKAMEEKGHVDLKRVKASLEKMKKELEVLKTAKQNAGIGSRACQVIADTATALTPSGRRTGSHFRIGSSNSSTGGGRHGT